jgi:hypothetical protein
MRRQLQVLLAAALVTVMPQVLFAADDSITASGTGSAVPSWTDVLNAWGLSANGYVAASYYASNGYPSNIHQFDVQHDTFQLDEAGFSLAYQPKQGFGALVDLLAGEDARILHVAEDGHDNSFDVRQAFVQYATGPFTLIAGKFVTLAGAEVINPTQNTNFSRSLLFTESEPLDHTGVRATYAVTGTLSLIAGVNNGWNITSTSYGPKTGEAGIAWAPGKALSLSTSAYFGKTQYLPGTTVYVDAERTLLDVVATYNATSALTFIVNADWDRQDHAFGVGTEDATWSGIAAYANYSFNDRWRVSLRGEYLDDAEGYLTATADGQHLWEGTATLGYDPTKHFELRLEGRYDASQEKFFHRTDPALAPVSGPVLADSLSELAVQGIFKF